MTGIDRGYNDLEIGEYVVFRRVFKPDNFQNFSSLSGDSNPVHHDHEYAVSAGYDQCLVPLYLYASPISAVAGMFIPGHRSLILKTNVNAITPLLYGEEITYSSKIVAKTDVSKVVTVKTIGFQGTRIIFDAETLVKVRNEPMEVENKWKQSNKLRGPADDNWLLITGATSDIGAAIAVSAATHGKNLILYYYSNQKKANAIKIKAKKLGVQVYVRNIKQLLPGQTINLSGEQWFSQVDSFVHINSSPVDSSLTDLVQSNYQILKRVMEALAPSFLEKQNGRLLNIGSSVIFRHSSHYSDYEAAKAASTNYTSSLNQIYNSYGIQCATLAPDVVDTDFSKDMLIDSEVEKLLPEEIAEKAIELLLEQGSWSSDCVWMTAAGAYAGSYRFASREHQISSMHSLETKKGKQIIDSETSADEEVDETQRRIKNIVAHVLKIDSDSLNLDSGITRTPAWDSLKHIEIVVELEKEFGIRFEADIITGIETVRELINCIESGSGYTKR
jgi:acyl carrier protein